MRFHDISLAKAKELASGSFGEDFRVATWLVRYGKVNLFANGQTDETVLQSFGRMT